MGGSAYDGGTSSIGSKVRAYRGLGGGQGVANGGYSSGASFSSQGGVIFTNEYASASGGNGAASPSAPSYRIGPNGGGAGGSIESTNTNTSAAIGGAIGTGPNYGDSTSGGAAGTSGVNGGNGASSGFFYSGSGGVIVTGKQIGRAHV